MLIYFAICFQFANFVVDFLVNPLSYPRVGWEWTDKTTALGLGLA